MKTINNYVIVRKLFCLYKQCIGIQNIFTNKKNQTKLYFCTFVITTKQRKNKNRNIVGKKTQKKLNQYRYLADKCISNKRVLNATAKICSTEAQKDLKVFLLFLLFLLQLKLQPASS